MTNKIGIVSYGYYIPKLRVKTENIAAQWGKDAEKIKNGLGVREKALGAIDEDSATIAVQAARMCFENGAVKPTDVGAIYVGSESKPYAVKPTASIVAAAINAGTNLTAADFEFACKAGTAGIQTAMGVVAAGIAKTALAIGADTAQGRPGDALEFSAGSGGAAMLIGNENVIATIDATFSFTTDTPDFWRRQHAEFPMHAGRFTGEPAYFKHVTNATKGILAKTGLTPKDFKYVVFHQPNGKFPTMVAKKLGFEREKVKQGLVTPFIGNTYSGASMIGLASVLDVLMPGEKVLVVSYGSGSGSDAFVITGTDKIKEKNRRAHTPLLKSIEDKMYVSYGEYLKHRRKIKSL